MSFTDWIHVIRFRFLGIDDTEIDRQDHRHHKQQKGPALDQHQRICRWSPPSPPCSTATTRQRWWPPRATWSRCHNPTAPPHFLSHLVQPFNHDGAHWVFDTPLPGHVFDLFHLNRILRNRCTRKSFHWFHYQRYKLHTLTGLESSLHQLSIQLARQRRRLICRAGQQEPGFNYFDFPKLALKSKVFCFIAVSFVWWQYLPISRFSGAFFPAICQELCHALLHKFKINCMENWFLFSQTLSLPLFFFLL